ncbi:MAG: class I SAM-dependent methyltransferase [Caulobacterales bacterium]
MNANDVGFETDAPDGYSALFQVRGAPYDRAMALHPDARREEFMQAIGRAALFPGATVADVPAGGGYLARYLPPECRWLGHEPCASFVGADRSKNVPLLPLPWIDGQADAAISIAGVHHLSEKAPLFAELARVVRPGGRLVLSDVHEGSRPARFLDGFVDRHNSTGHVGDYLGEHTLVELRKAGWTVISHERVAFHWRFNNPHDMAAFCYQMFDLRTSSPEETARTIEAQLGFDRDSGGVGMRWELYTVVATPAAAKQP